MDVDILVFLCVQNNNGFDELCLIIKYYYLTYFYIQLLIINGGIPSIPHICNIIRKAHYYNSKIISGFSTYV